MAEPVRSLGESGGYALELSGVGRRFGALTALADVSLSVRAGERRAVLGSNGAGKTTLFNTITGDFAPSSGTIRFFGEDVTGFPTYERIRRGLRRTYQISLLFGGLNVIDFDLPRLPRGLASPLLDAAAGRDDATMEQATRIMHAVQLEDIANRWSPSSAMASSGSSRSRSPLPARRGFILLDEPAAGSRRRSGATSCSS